MRRFTNDIDLLNQALREEYSTDLTSLSAALTLDLALGRLPLRERLSLFYLLYCPRKVGRVGRVAAMYTHNERDLNRGLRKSYGADLQVLTLHVMPITPQKQRRLSLEARAEAAGKAGGGGDGASGAGSAWASKATASPDAAAKAMFEDDDDDDDNDGGGGGGGGGIGVASFMSPEGKLSMSSSSVSKQQQAKPSPMAVPNVDDESAEGMAAASEEEACVIYLAGRPLCHNALLCALWVRAVQVA